MAGLNQPGISTLLTKTLDNNRLSICSAPQKNSQLLVITLKLISTLTSSSARALDRTERNVERLEVVFRGAGS